MARFAPVVPLEIARELPREDLGSYHLLLAHDVVKHPAEYREVYGHLEGSKEAGSCIIMDNSLVELGHPAPMDMLLEACHALKPHFLVMPDHLGKSEETVHASYNFMQEWRKEIDKRPYLRAIGLVGVIQGEHPAKFWRTIGLYKNNEDLVGMVALPRVMVEQFGSRMRVINGINKVFGKSVPIHLLGFSNDILDDICSARMPGIYGIDSAVPVRLGLQGRIIELGCEQDPGPRGKYWDDPFSTMPYRTMQTWKSHVIANLKRVRKWIDTSKMLWQHVRQEHIQD